MNAPDFKAVDGDAAAESPISSASAPLAIYLHWPFCAQKCPYCDFNSHVRDAVDQDRWRAALLRELDHYADRVGPRRVGSVFFGGGTPSLAPPATIAALIDRIGARFAVDPDVEITLEANPTSVEAAAFADLRAAGVNRVSLGVQSLDDDALRFLGRTHDAATARHAATLAARVFPRWSLDLIYALPGQTEAAWMTALDQALTLAGDHLSLYQLTIEAQTAFEGAVRRGDFTPMDDDAAADLFAATQDRLNAAGFPAYEVSNHACPGGESRHNLAYWRSADYLGVGPGAHGRITLDGARRATRQHRAPEIWLDRVETAGHATQTDDALTPADHAREMLVMGLRLSEGVARADLAAAVGGDWRDVVDAEFLRVAAAEGLLVADDDRIVATAAGRPVLNALLSRLAR